MGWRAWSDFLSLGLSEAELQALDGGKASPAILRKVANLPQALSAGLTKYFQLDADITNESYDDFPGGSVAWEFGQLIPIIHQFSRPQYKQEWLDTVKIMSDANPAMYRQLTGRLRAILGRTWYGGLKKARARIKWTVVKLPSKDWTTWYFKFARDDMTGANEPFPRDRVFDIEIELGIVLP